MVQIDAAKEILKQFYFNPFEKKHIRGIAEGSSFSYERIYHYLKELEKKGVMLAFRKGKTKEYGVNHENAFVEKIFSLIELEKKLGFLEKNPEIGKHAENFKKKLVEKIRDPVESVLLYGPILKEKTEDAHILILSNQLISIPVYKEIEKTCKECSEKLNFLVYVDSLPDFRVKWFNEKEYRENWRNGIILYGEEIFWREILRIEGELRK